MRKIWNTILPALLILLGTILAPQYVVVSEPLTYVWVILLQVPVTIIAMLLTVGISTLFVVSPLFGTKAGWACLLIALFFLGFIVGVIAFMLMDKILAGLTINGFGTYVILSILYSMLGLSAEKQERRPPDYSGL